MRFRRRLVLGFSASVLMIAAGAAAYASGNEVRDAFRRPLDVPFPESNPYTLEKAALGKALFFDPRLSRFSNMTCAGCHNPSFGWQVPVSTAVGATGKPLSRRSPTLLNLAWSSTYFLDGRADSLELQARGPIEAKAEMGLPLDDAVRRLKAVPAYRTWFSSAFPGEGVSAITITQALATYQRTIVSSYAPFDAWVAGDDRALSPEAVRGFELFTGQAGCASCHSGWNFTDGRFHDIGLSTRDVGRGALEPGNVSARFAFKTPTLRDIARRAPFMHDGSIVTLEGVVAHYNSGGIERPSKAKQVRKLGLAPSDVRALVAFLDSLTGDKPIVDLPVLPH